jgi:hypothetical protein
LLAIFVLAVFGMSARAQVGIYGKLDLNHHDDNNSNSSHMLYGGGVGVYYNFVHEGPLTVGGDLRGDFLSGDNLDYRSLLFGLPLGFRIPVVHVKPYVEPLVGVGGAKATGPTGFGITPAYSSKLTYGFVGGLDVTVLPHLDWRAIEAGYTREKNGTLSDPNVLVSTGLVVRF